MRDLVARMLIVALTVLIVPNLRWWQYLWLGAALALYSEYDEDGDA